MIAERRARKVAGLGYRAFLRGTHPAVRSQLASAVPLPVLLQRTPGTLTLAQRKRLIEQAILLLEQNYVHLPLKRAMHAVDPVQRLRLLQQRVSRSPAGHLTPEMEFHREMLEIFTSVRDLHTNYLLPAPFADKVAFLPFMVEDYFEDGTRKYLVSHVMQGFSEPKFVAGVEIICWNGVPIDRAVLANGQRFAGSNSEALLARGVETLTTRPLMSTLPPDEEWVVVGYRTLAHKDAELRVDWLAFAPDAVARRGDPAQSYARTLGLDVELDWVHRARKPLFAPKVVKAEHALRKGARKRPSARTPKERKSTRASRLQSRLPNFVEARKVVTASGTFGYLRIRSFMVDDNAFLAEVIRLLAELPQEGLILDVRQNGGGNIFAAERLLQLFTPRRIEPEPFQFINTSLTLRMSRRAEELQPWADSIDQALQTGSVFSAAVPITPVDRCNSHGQVYHGPVVLVTDALCYSATDIFAAGFQDHAIGPILGTDGNTGAGGANVWTHQILSEIFERPPADRDSPYRALPNGAEMRVAIRRTLRVGARSGTPVEDLGVIPTERHFMTRDDLLEDNVDLIRRAGSLLASLPVRRLTATVTARTATKLTLSITTQGLSRIDVYTDDRPERTLDVRNGTTSIDIGSSTAGPRSLRLEGFAAATLVAARRISIV